MRKFKNAGVVLVTESEDGNVSSSKEIKVAPFDVAGLLRFSEELRAVDLPLPQLDGKQVMGWGEKQTEVTAAVVEIFTKNMPALFQWVTTSPVLLPVFLEETTNLTKEEVDSLTGGQAWKVARAAWAACVEDGAFSEMAGFFGDLFRGAAVAGATLVA